MKMKNVIYTAVLGGVVSVMGAEQERPNLLWISCEDISPTLPMYGDHTAKTPHLDRLAEESIIYDQAFATVPVCGPSRSSIITGMYPISIGTQHMRTGPHCRTWGLRKLNKKKWATDINGDEIPRYSAVVPPYVKPFTELLRADGYYCANNWKTDYQFSCPVTAWDVCSTNAHWRTRAPGQPFFAVFNSINSHESRIWVNDELPLTVHPADVPLPGYFPDTPTVRHDVARNYSNIELMDAELGQYLDDLKDDGLLDNTIIVFFSDHGGPLPRGKCLNYESGLRVPLMIHLPDQLKKERITDIVSLMDLGPTMLSLLGIPVPETMQGHALLGPQRVMEPRQYAFSSVDRIDDGTDRVRTVTDKDYIFVRNYAPDQSSYMHRDYRMGIPMMGELIALRDAGQLNATQQYWFRETKRVEEFYDRHADPLNVHNLIDHPEYKAEIERMRGALDHWLAEVGDQSEIPERELFLRMWPNGEQPQAAQPKLTQTAQGVRLDCVTEGASIAYLITADPIEPNLDSGWKLYHQPIKVPTGAHLYVMGTRIGFKDSEIVVKDY